MPTASWPACPDCGSESVEVLHEANPDAKASHATLQCQACERVFRDVLETPEDLEVRCVISDDAESWPTTVLLPEGERIRVDDEVYAEGHRLLVTAVEHEDGHRVRSAVPEDLGTIWCKVFDTVTVKVAVNQGHRTWTGDLEVSPEEEFLIGDEITLKWGDARIHAIKTETGVRHDGSAPARTIKRLYAKALDAEPIGFEDLHGSAQRRDEV